MKPPKLIKYIISRENEKVYVDSHSKNKSRIVDVAKLGECLPNRHKVLGSIPALHKSCVVAHPCNPSTWEGKARRLEVQGHPLLLSEVKASLGHSKFWE